MILKLALACIGHQCKDIRIGDVIELLESREHSSCWILDLLLSWIGQKVVGCSSQFGMLLLHALGFQQLE